MVFFYFWISWKLLLNQVITHGSNLTFTFVSMSYLEFFLKKVLAQNFNFVELANFFEKNKEQS
jgi:hypothetical protein